MQRSRYFLIAAALLTTGIAAFVLRPAQHHALPPRKAAKQSSSVLESPDLRPTSHEPMKRASFVGTATCKQCHSDQHASYLMTAHSKALRPVDASLDVPGHEMHHALSGRSYRVYRAEGRLRHTEKVSLGEGDRAVTFDFPIKFAVGSGNHAQTFLVEADGYLLESPLTWYSTKRRWDMSPGYDNPYHQSFERVVGSQCLFCHAGRVEPHDKYRDQVTILEQSIGCESCHGPGSLHSDHYQKNPRVVLNDDPTIVNPAKLPREQQESVCAQCHLSGSATVLIRGRSLFDFRPGDFLADYRVDYTPHREGRPMEVVGHVEQMRLSRCYQESGTMTCITCHNPHDRPAAEKAAHFYRDKCNSCHDGHCGLEQGERLSRNPENDCIACHMAPSATQVPHLAFTHHRILRTPEEQVRDEDKSDDVYDLIPVFPVDHLPPEDRDRCLGIAYLSAAGRQSPKARVEYVRRSVEILEAIHRGGLQDAETELTLAQAYRIQEDFDRAMTLADSSLRKPVHDRAIQHNALFTLGESSLAIGLFEQAIERFEQLVGQRRSSQDWYMLGLAQKFSGDLSGSVASFLTAIEINPFRAEIRDALREVYEQMGETDKANEQANAIRFVSPTGTVATDLPPFEF